MSRHNQNIAVDNFSPRYPRKTIEFSRPINLGDAVFAIAMTLLGLTIDISDVPNSF